MSTLPEHKIDRTGWKSGPWNSEPDRVEFEHHGFPCLIVRARLGALCGYVGVPPTHKLYEKNYSEAPVDIHGGLTYSDKCQGYICHVPKPGETDERWWFGFDCAHAWDIIPGMSKYEDITPSSLGESYKDIEFVRSEVRDLAEQLEGLA